MPAVESQPIPATASATELIKTADAQATWSQTADRLKQRLDLARKSSFCLSILGAVLTTIASQKSGELRHYLAIFGAAPLGVASFVASRFLAGSQVTSWVRARAAAEALKREAWTYAAGGAPYTEKDQREARLHHERERIEKDVDDLIGLAMTPKGSGSSPRATVSRDEYVASRVRGQIEHYYVPRSHYSQRVATALRWLECTLSLCAAIVAATIGLAGKDAFGSVDFIAFTAVLTTIGGAIVAHIEASRYDFLVTSYLATARRLRNELGSTTDFNAMSDTDWSDFVQRCEAILGEQNGSWLSKWTKLT